jgi:hypothetical protein
LESPGWRCKEYRAHGYWENTDLTWTWILQFTSSDPPSIGSITTSGNPDLGKFFEVDRQWIGNHKQKIKYLTGSNDHPIDQQYKTKWIRDLSYLRIYKGFLLIERVTADEGMMNYFNHEDFFEKAISNSHRAAASYSKCIKVNEEQIADYYAAHQNQARQPKRTCILF